MSDKQDLETRLRAYLARGADKRAPSELEQRLLDEVPVAGSRWVPQLLAAAAVVLLVIGVGFGFQSLRSQRTVRPGGGGVTSPSPTPDASSTAIPAPSTTAAPPSAGQLGLSSIHMTSVTAGWATGDTTNQVYGPTSAVFRTTDGGNVWRRVSPPDTVASDAFFLNDTSAWFLDNKQNLYRTRDSGNSWQLLSHMRVAALAPTFLDSKHGWQLVGLGAAAGSESVEIDRTVDGGATWQQVSVTTGPDAQSTPGSLPFGCNKGVPRFVDASTGWAPGECAGGQPFFYVTHDGGQTWRNVNLPLPAAAGTSCACGTSAPVFTSARDGVFLMTGTGASGGGVSVLYVTHDAGVTWSFKTLPTANPGQVDFINADRGWLVDALNGTVSLTNDGGSDWSPISTIPVVTNVPQLDFVDQNTGFALRGAGKAPLLRTTDGGHTWKEIQPTL